MAVKKPEEERKTAQIVIRVTPSVKAKIEAVAQGKDIKTSEFVRSVFEKGIARYKVPAAKPAPKAKRATKRAAKKTK